ncbi:MAG: hypothetical protein WC899_07355 [bacterium]
MLIFRENRRKAAAGAVGGLAAMGALYAVGCFALGCCACEGPCTEDLGGKG